MNISSRDGESGRHPRLPAPLPGTAAGHTVLQTCPLRGENPDAAGISREGRDAGQGGREAHGVVPAGGREGEGDRAPDCEEPHWGEGAEPHWKRNMEECLHS